MNAGIFHIQPMNNMQPMNTMNAPKTSMGRRSFLARCAVGGLALYGMGARLGATETTASGKQKMLGMYVHCAWPYRAPYAARNWTFKHWRSYAEGLKRLGFNTIVIWPVIEIMPTPLQRGDQAALQKLSRVIDMLHDMDFRVYTTLLPNLVVDNEAAQKATFDKRHYFHSLKYVDPSDEAAVRAMVNAREELLRPLSKMDGCVIIDSDTGSYPGATNDQFISILLEHRRMFDRLRPGIEMLYWMHVGWEGYARYHETGTFGWGTREEAVDVLTKLKKANPEPWGLSVHSPGAVPYDNYGVANDLDLTSRAVLFNYGAIEGEPTFPMTNFGGDAAYKGGQAAALRGVVGNAQTHCAQLPNTFAFARGFKNEPIAEGDYATFADKLIRGYGELIVEAWKAIAGEDVVRSRSVADRVEKAAKGKLLTGELEGLLFGEPRRFMNDLVLQLRFRAAGIEFMASSADRIDATKFKAFVSALENWHAAHGYQCLWNIANMPKLDEILKKFDDPAIDTLLGEKDWWSGDKSKLKGSTPFEQNQYRNLRWDAHTARMIVELQRIANSM